MFMVDKNGQLDLATIIQQFQTQKLPILNKYYNYYKGKQAILNKMATDKGKFRNNVVVNYCYNITQNYLGYLTGIDIAYSSENNFDDIQNILNYNDVHSQDSELLRQALIYGVGYEIAYIDIDGNQRFKPLDSRSVIPVYDNTLDNNLLYVIRLYGDTANNEYMVDVYDAVSVSTFRSNMGYSSFVLLEQKPHFFNQVPITVFSLNTEEESIFDKVITLQDAYNTLISSTITDWETFCDCYMVLKGVTADQDDLAQMKESRVMIVDADASAEYLTKEVNDTQIQNLLTNINDSIHKIANSPDFNDEKFMAQSGIAMRFKLVGFENQASSIEANMRKALQKRIELICEVSHLKGIEAVWRDVKIVFTRNLPTNTLETAQMVNSLRGLVSDETLLSLLPFVTDTTAELERLNAQKEANMSMYSFPTGIEEDDE